MTTARLPRGRHHLSREDVATTQRNRILTAFAEVLVERGYADTPVAAILQRAGVSRETFYQQFSSKQDCFVAALEETVGQLGAALIGGPAGGSPLERFDRLLGRYLAVLAADPATARLFLIETYAAGPEAMRRRVAMQAQFADGIAAIFGARSARRRAICEALVGAVVSMVTARFVADDVAGLAAIRRPVVELAAATLT